MYSDTEEQRALPMPVAAVVPPNEYYSKERQNYSIPIGIGVLASLFFPPLGIPALILAVMAYNKRNNLNESERLKRISYNFSLAAFLALILVFAAALMAAFANRGSDIFIRTKELPAVRYFWKSEA
ncbi:hypothetical protein HELRODRAFT_170569 [Helobdella robusta]|uniref:DUF4190 domain-containing protein n=1 Tax=Helobdella robusta TaxID=6412 RepID=T1F368_HELRO|nr:hypothetical protein HELRODRAFT_170569 [Helobdella robusta]ESO07246.1 hypothetical protein HELRODRAFT_170569 [Helobdella robusta]